MSKAIKYYYDLLSPPSRALWIALKLAKTPFEECPVALRKKEQLTDEYKRINRFQKVPALVDGNYHLSESLAMVRYVNIILNTPNDFIIYTLCSYLADSKKLTEQLYPKGLEERGRIDEYLEWQNLNVRLPCSLYFREAWLFPANGIKPKPKQEKIDQLVKNVETGFSQLERLWLDNDYLLGPNLTVADLFSSSDIEQLRLCQYTVNEKKFPKVAKWLDRVREASQPHHELAHAFLNKKPLQAAQSKA
ncbi:hypothetical protein KR093_005748 [Drosophila rubida]|uniref:Uncharacterized protein n=1 Tax=Drosophila rubida TaxID=30044 RepID=A0AAD4PQK0_9MUSC|nr:hypothetical protein KR093_005748 [Drosophila rubida]